MSLRRIIEHLRAQHWTAVVIDFVIVVLGVFVGIQVSNWNQARAADRQAAEFTRHLREDLREEAWAYQLYIDYHTQVRDNAQRAVDALSGIAPLSDEALLVAAYRATQYKQRLRRRATYDELISTGTIGLVRDRHLRDTAMRVYGMQTFDNLAREGKDSRYREAFREILPNGVQRALARTCGDLPTPVGDYAKLQHALEYPCTTGLAADEARLAAATLRAETRLVPLLRLRIADIETRLSDLTSNNADIRRALRAQAGTGAAAP